ncbi:MAG: Uma2 family endonuclease [Verrucomicrobia bacterium]|nr:Uma2 family endonuclease [Verrucomicrobiota bacterium]
MSLDYEEIIEGVSVLRRVSVRRHEEICEALHDAFAAALAGSAVARLLEPRSIVQLSPGSLLRPDLALVTAATGKLWLAAEVVSSTDHRWDTVTKKELYEAAAVPRLWMVDPRYNNVEIYHGSPHGLALQHIYAGSEMLTERLLPTLQVAVAELFSTRT